METYEWFQIFILIVTAIILIWQLSAIRRATALEGFNEIATILNDSDNREVRKELYKNKEKLEELEPEIKTKIKNQIVLLDTLGCLVNRKLIPERVAIEIYWDVIIRCWDASEEWIEEERQEKRDIQSQLEIKPPLQSKIYRKLPNIFLNIFKKIKKKNVLNKMLLRLLYKKKESSESKSSEFKYYPFKKPITRNYGDTYCENFEMLVWRCERYCWKRNLDRPAIY